MNDRNKIGLFHLFCICYLLERWLLWRFSLISKLITGIDDVQSIPVIITGIAEWFFDGKKIPGIDKWNSDKNTALTLWKPHWCREKLQLMPWLVRNTQCREEEESLWCATLVDCYVSHGTGWSCSLFCSWWRKISLTVFSL